MRIAKPNVCNVEPVLSGAAALPHGSDAGLDPVSLSAGEKSVLTAPRPEGPAGQAEWEEAPADDLVASQRLARLFQPFESMTSLLLAVSGGPDSVALMLLAARWRRDRESIGTPVPLLHVASVDHGLRPDSALEAENVGKWAERLGLPHHLLRWEGEKPKTRLQERAREARYALLTAHAERIGAEGIVTAHHADDQAETILFRLLRGSGLRGLRGMEAFCLRNGLPHFRPLLELTKADLLTVCVQAHHPFVRDPSNTDTRFARARLRGMERQMAEIGLDRMGLLRLGRRAARADEAIIARTAQVRTALPAERRSDTVSVDCRALRDEPEEILLRFIEAEILALSEKGQPLRLDRLETLSDGLGAALHAASAFKATLGGICLHLDACGRLDLRREGPRGAKRQRPIEV
ncbi:tRNA lysidine(34) synthetase TilS [Beijerinckia mobilis]|uniref:tRNA lysidine(34) synthetase TilS n=1 Tax=Beijerinckia mobilis TaxID=231434 RepID=UPI000A0319FD|nr:tRNA lysidine(34) synthetase TilS [Beijerinckia mobilis]